MSHHHLREALTTTLVALLTAAAWSTSLSAQQVAAPVRALLRELDERFVKGDVAGYLARFAPDNDGAVAMVGRRLQRQVHASRTRERTTRVVAGPTPIGDRSLVRVRRDISLVSSSGEVRRWLEDSILILCDDGGQTTPTMSIETTNAAEPSPVGRLRCGPCNYQIGGVDAFFCVPMRREETLALGSASFYLAGTDVACDIHVQLAASAEPARAAALRLANALARLEPAAAVGLATNWLPPAHAAAPPGGIDGAQVIVELPRANAAASGDRARFHVLIYGGLQYVLLTRGDAGALDAHQPELDALYQSFALLDVDREPTAAATAAIRHYQGGRFEGDRYENQRYGVTFFGPSGWQPRHRVSGAAFRARWSSPDDSRVWLTGYTPPRGHRTWTEQAADRWLSRLFQDHDLEPVEPQPADVPSRWRRGETGDRERTIVLLDRDPDLTAPRRRIVHLQLRADLLLILDGYGATPRSEQAVLTATTSLRRAR